MLRYWLELARFVAGGNPSRAASVPLWALALPIRAWNDIVRPDGKTFADLHGAKLSPLARRLLPLRALYAVSLFFWPVVAALRALGRGRGAPHFWRSALRRPELAMLFPHADFSQSEIDWMRPDYALSMYYAWEYSRAAAPHIQLENKHHFLRSCAAAGFPLPPSLTPEAARLLDEDVIIKDADRDLGFGVRRVRGADLELELLARDDDAPPPILQRRLHNHRTLRAVFGDEAPLSSLRVITTRTPTGEVRVSRCAVRVGRAGSVIDNTMQGGQWHNVDLPSGTLKPGVTKKSFGRRHRGERLLYETHPDTGRRIAGLAVPYLAEAQELACRAHQQLAPAALSLGWDLALAEEGLCFLEVNVWTVCYDDAPPDDAFTPACQLIIDALAHGSTPAIR